MLVICCNEGYSQEQYGQTWNFGFGAGGYSGFYSYANRTIPAFNINYEIDVAPNFTLAPFVSIYTFSDDLYWGNNNVNYRYYSYKEIVIPVGVKGYYYFDDLLELNSDWDIYGAASMGVALSSSIWENGYLGDKNYYHNGNAVFLDLHIGAAYHINNKFGVYLDLSSGISTIGIQKRH